MSFLSLNLDHQLCWKITDQLPLLSKVFEKVAHGQLVSYLRDKKILYTLQFGFCPGRSTFHAMQSFLNYVYDNFESDDYVFRLSKGI